MPTDSEIATQIKTLRRQRGSIQGAITSFVKKLDSWEENTENLDEYLLRESLDYLVRRFESFETIQEQLEVLDESEVTQREPLQESYISAVARAKKYLREISISNDDTSVKSHPNSHSCCPSASSLRSNSISIKLPEINLPQFDGKIENWAGFYDLFTSVVEKSDLSDAGKLAYLKGSVSGKALSLIECYNTTDENYKIVLELLKGKFEFPRRALRRHWAILREFPALTKDTPTGLGNIVEVFQKNLKALENLGAPVAQWDVTIIDLILTKISSNTAFYWEVTLKDNEMPKYTHLLEFLEKRANSSDFSTRINTDSSTNHRPPIKNSKFAPYKNASPALVAASDSTNKGCKHCKSDTLHMLYQCPLYKKLNIADRKELIKKFKLCFNCVNQNCARSKNFKSQCSSSNVCQRCRQNHHTSICHSLTNVTTTGENQVPSESTTDVNKPMEVGLVSVAAVAEATDLTSTVLLGSALIHVQGGDGRFYTLRCIIDSAASSSFITLAAAKRIGLVYEAARTPDPVAGIGGGLIVSGIQGHTTCLVKPKHADQPMLPTWTTVITKIVTDLPCTRVAKNVRSYFSRLNLADDQFHVVREVDFLVGADIFPHVYTGEKHFGPPGFPAALNSIFGYVVTGRIGQLPDTPFSNVALITTPSTDELLRKFWELEEVPTSPLEHPDDVIAENMYQTQHYRLPEGRYVAPILLRQDAPPLGESKNMALRRLTGLLRRLDRDAELKAQYTKFMDEYEKLGHMTLVPPERASQAKYYIPHHYVLRNDGDKSKLRVVFDASALSSSGFSLNETVYSGKKLQKDIFDIISRFRIHQLVFTCDISKMYRQILVKPEDRTYQHIFWPVNGEIREFELNTVTYGVTSSPFSALRTIHQLKSDDGSKEPMAAEVLDRDMFVDDLATGKDTVPELLELKRQTVNLLGHAQCEASKWASNCTALMNEIPPEHRATSLDLDGAHASTKILGVHWDAQSDSFYFTVKIEPHRISKRSILSHLARIFDPIGIIAPIVFKAKAIMQKLWLAGVDWDSTAPEEIADEWSQFYEKLPAICSLKFNRCVVVPNAHFHSLIGFADASMIGYCAVVYLRSESTEGVKVSLLASKTRVAPTKTVSIPRLELCAAKLLASLMSHIETQYKGVLNINHVAAFTDAQVVLAWIKTIPCKLKTFEANRVSFILSRIEPAAWKFCPSEQNPADVGSKGCYADQLENHPLWWTGPTWLADPIDQWPNFESKAQPFLAFVEDHSDFWETFMIKYSSLSKLQRVTAWLLRYARNSKLKPEDRLKTPNLTVQELDDSMKHLIKVTQLKHFSAEIKSLAKKDEVPKTMKTLTPFIDSDGLLRVGGRLKNTELSFAAKHPLLLPKRDHFVNILIDAYHQRYLQAGFSSQQSLLWSSRRGGGNQSTQIVRFHVL